jgi:hypothetical protein
VKRVGLVGEPKFPAATPRNLAHGKLERIAGSCEILARSSRLGLDATPCTSRRLKLTNAAAKEKP